MQFKRIHIHTITYTTTHTPTHTTTHTYTHTLIDNTFAGDEHHLFHDFFHLTNYSGAIYILTHEVAVR